MRTIAGGVFYPVFYVFGVLVESLDDAFLEGLEGLAVLVEDGPQAEIVHFLGDFVGRPVEAQQGREVDDGEDVAA